MKPTEEQLEAICVAMDPIPEGLETQRAEAAYWHVRDIVLEEAAKVADGWRTGHTYHPDGPCPDSSCVLSRAFAAAIADRIRSLKGKAP